MELLRCLVISMVAAAIADNLPTVDVPWDVAIKPVQGQTFPLGDAIVEALTPVFLNLSAVHNDSAWSLHYRDVDGEAAFCVGYADIDSRVPCTVNDVFAWGSTTKVQTSTDILKLVEEGLIDLDDSIVLRGDEFLRKISNDTMDLVSLYNATINNVTIRHLLQMESGIDEYDSESVRIYQVTHPSEDLTPMWILNESNRTFICEPGTCGRYSSTNYVLLGLVIGQYTNASDWDKVSQGLWKPNTSDTMFESMRYAVHGPCSNFTDAVGFHGSSIHGYQPTCRPNTPPRSNHRCVPLNESDVIRLSSTQGWTCGNLMSPPSDIANFFYELLGPRSSTENALLSQPMLKEMLTFKIHNYFGRNLTSLVGAFGYGLGMMNFTSMDWGFDTHGKYFGHNGLTYGFGSQSGYNYDYKFSATWVNNCEKWIGPEPGQRGTPNKVYDVLVNTVKKFRPAESKSINPHF